MLCLVLDARAVAALGPSGLAEVVAAGVDRVQVRERGRDGATLVALVDEVLRAVRGGAERAGRSAQVVVNRRVDVALAAAADGVHLGFDAMPADAARRLLGEEALVGVSCHAPEEVEAAAGADTAHLAPIFAPLSKPATRAPLGPGALAAVRAGRRTLLAQGGVGVENAGACLAAGADGVAVTGSILAAPQPAAAAAALRSALDAAAAAR